MIMKILLVLIGILAGLFLLVIGVTLLGRSWYSHWGASPEEVDAVLPGDELAPAVKFITTKAVTIQAKPAEIYPWLLQMGADKGGLYSYAWLEALIRCPNNNADRIHPEWQDLKAGDLVRMCPGDSGPPPFVVAEIEPDKHLIWGHTDPDGSWNSTYQFILQPTAEGDTRLILRTRSPAMGAIWDMMQLGFFIMERKMLMGIRERAE
jgi:hypothetical protein